MRKHVLAALCASGALLLTLAPATLAAPLSKTEGAPDIDKTGYYLWHADNGFHLRTHGPGAEHDFDAVLRTRGTFENVDVVDGGHQLNIHFHTFDFTDGVNFTVRGGERLHLSLKLDDKLAPTEQIFLGAKRVHPRKNPFSIKL